MARTDRYKREDDKKAAKRAAKEYAKARREAGRKPKSKGVGGAISRFREWFLSGTKKQIALRTILGVFCIGMLFVLLTVGFTAIKVGRINMESLYNNIEMSSNIYDINGEQVDTLHYTQDRQIVKLEDMPEELGQAFIAIEDKTFYKHHGFNFRRMFGAVLSKLLGRSDAISGTSTITQQLARNAYLADIKSQRSIRRKLSEMYIAWRLEHNLTKDEILEAYLNTIYLGYGNYGVGAASRTYFSKDASELDLAECAALAALPQAPDSYALITTEPGDGNVELKNVTYYTLDEIEEPSKTDDTSKSNTSDSDDSDDADEESEGTGFYANDISKDRRNMVLQLMADQGYITQDEAAAADVDIADILKPSFEKSESAYTYFTDYVAGVVMKDLIDQYKISEDEAQRMVYTGGLDIYTTLRSDIQTVIYKEFQNDSNFPTAVDGSEVQASMVVTEVGTGNISALVGGRNADGSQLFNRAVSPRQPGSSIKPLAVYGAALQKSFDYAAKGKTFPYIDYGFDNQGTKYWGDYITASSVVVDEPLKINGKEWPQNFSKTYSGKNSLRTALQQSINTCAVKILWQVGLDYSVNMLEKYGLTTLVTDENEESNDVNPAALALGAMTYGVTPLEMSLAYAVYPNGGKINTPVCYTKIVDKSGKTLLTGKSKSSKVLDEGVAWIMTDLLKSVVSDGIAGNAAISGVKVGGKTGTTNDTYDVWFDGFTPDYAAALWIGTDLNVEMNGGSGQAARLWGRIMGQVPGISSGEYSDMPSNVVKKGGEYYTSGTDKNPGQYVKESNNKKEEVVEEVEVPEVDTDTTTGGGSTDSNKSTDTSGGSTTPGTDPSSGGGSTDPSGGGGTTPTPDPGGGDSGGTTPTPDPGSGGGSTDQSGQTQSSGGTT